MPDILDFWENRWDSIELIIRGVLINDGAEFMRVIPLGPRFIAGRTPLAPGFVDEPIRIHPNYSLYLLAEKAVALFEWHAGCSVDNWVDLFRHEPDATPVRAEFLCFQGSNDQNVTTVTLEIGSRMVYPVYGEERKWKVAQSTPIIYVNSERHYHKDTNLLRQELTGEPAVLHVWPGNQDS
jgi:hypothetical protein